MHKMKFSMAAAALIAAFAGVADAQTYAITGGKVFPVSGPPIENGTVIIRGSKIIAVGANVAIPSDATRIDATGKWVTPGLIHSATQLGVQEVSQVSNTRDDVARGKDQIAASFAIWEGFNTNSALLTPTRDEGITSVAILPGGGGLVSGQAGFITLVPGSLVDMLVRAPIAMLSQLGNPQGAGVNARAEQIGRLRELIEDTRAFMRNRAAFERSETRDYAASRKDLEAMIPVVQGTLPLIVITDRSSDIETALIIAREYGLKIMIGSGAEAWMVADKIAAAKVPVLTGAMNNIPGSFSSLGTRQENAALLRRAGVTVVMVGNSGNGDEETYNVRNIKQEAGNAVAYGMSWTDALRSVTLSPAEVFGVSNRVGSLAPGKDANVVVWNGDPFEFATRAEHVFVHGLPRMEPNRQNLLIERYRVLPPQGRR